MEKNGHIIRDWAWCVGLLALAAVIRLPTLGQPLLEAHIFRQAQTAYTALLFHQDGIDLLRPQLPVLGPPWHVPFEFPLFQAAASVLMDLGLAPDPAMRATGLATFLITGVLLFGLVRHVVGTAAAIVTVAAWSFSPFSILWGRTSMIEYLATAGAVGFLWAGVAWADRGSPGAYATSLLAGTLGTLVKISTAAFYLLPLLLYRGKAAPRPRWPLLVGALVVVPVAMGLLWTAHADGVKGASEATASLASGSAPMRAFNFGTIGDRLEIEGWGIVLRTLTIALGGLLLPVWVGLGVVAAWRHPQRAFLLALFAIAGVAPMLVFTPLYVLHDYYLAAVSPVVAVLVGVAASWLWDARRAFGARATAAGLGTAWLASLVVTSGYWGQAYGPAPDRERTLAAAEYVATRTSPDEWVVLRGRDWDASVLYYARRRGFMVRPMADDRALFAELSADPRYTLFVDCPFSGDCRPLELDR